MFASGMGHKMLLYHFRRGVLLLRRRTSPLRFCIYLVVAIIVMWLVRTLWRPPMDWEVSLFRDELDDQNEPIQKHDKWIVVTTIQAPTPAMKALAEIPGWKMVVVGDKKTPPWSLPGVVYLSLTDQEKMRFTVLNLLPYNAYARKIVGYLYAIKHGAIYIYDTDDDNIPTGRLQGFHLTSPTHSLLLTTSNLTVNPYIHFGQSTLWPRGYPMDHLGKTTPQDYKLCEMKSPSIQIGLADGDPDLDSVARLTRKLANSHMNIHFDPAAPLFVVPEGTYVPINSQVTMFRYKAFWSLVFPMSVTFRTADIYRGYWQQRLLWLIGDRVGNLGPIVRHDRSYHNYIDDALQEYDLLKMGKLLEVMNRWQCTRLHFFSCVTALAWELVHGGFWEREDVDLIDAWLTDLASIGYVSPMLRDPPHPACMQSSVPQQVHFQAHEQTTTLIHSSTNFQPPDTNNLETVHTFIQNTCHFSSLPRPAGSASFPHLLLVIQLESAGTILPVLEAWYRPHFPNILYCGHQDQVAQDLLARFRVSFLGLRQGDGHVSCMSHALRMGYNVTGYLFAPETALLRPRVLEAHRASQLWLTQNWEVSEPAQIESCRKQTIHCQEFNTKSLSTLSERTAELRVGSKLQLKIKACFSKLSSNPALKNKSWYLRDLVFYLPSRLTQQFQQISAVYSNLKGEDFDIVTVLLLECLEVAPEYLTFSSTLGAQTGPEDYVFPYQPQEVISKGPVNTHFCQNVV